MPLLPTPAKPRRPQASVGSPHGAPRPLQDRPGGCPQFLLRRTTLHQAGELDTVLGSDAFQSHFGLGSACQGTGSIGVRIKGSLEDGVPIPRAREVLNDRVLGAAA